MIGPPIEPEYCFNSSGMSTGLMDVSVVGVMQALADRTHGTEAGQLERGRARLRVRAVLGVERQGRSLLQPEDLSEHLHQIGERAFVERHLATLHVPTALVERHLHREVAAPLRGGPASRLMRHAAARAVRLAGAAALRADSMRSLCLRATIHLAP